MVDPHSLPKGPGQQAQLDGPTAGAPAAVNGIVDGGFENGPDGSWYEYSEQGWPLILDEEVLLTPPHGGRWAVWLGGADDEISAIVQIVTVPANAQEAVLGFWMWIASADSCENDLGGVVINNATAVDVFYLCTETNTDTWVKRVVDLSAYAGQTVQLDIRAETDSSANSNLFVDDVTLGTTAPEKSRTFLPVLRRQPNQVPQFAPPCSASNVFCEQFNTMTTAYGPLRPGQAYSAYPNDTNDYYRVVLARNSTLNVDVTNYQADGQVLVRRTDKSSVGRDINQLPGGDGQMNLRLRDLPAGTYYLQVYTGGALNQNHLYTLTINY